MKENAEYLNFLVKSYDGLTQLISKTKQRLGSLPGDVREEKLNPLLNGEKEDPGLVSLKGRLRRQIEKELEMYDVWNFWLKNVNGIGPWIAAVLIVKFNYKFVPICNDCGGEFEKKKVKDKNTFVCKDCDKQHKGEGVFRHKTVGRDFPTISKWWAYMGRGPDGSGNLPKRKKGEQSNWSTELKTIGFHIYEQFNRKPADDFYKSYFISKKKRHEKKHPDWTKGHIHAAGGNETAKLFLSHFWTVSRYLDGKPISRPYVAEIMGHTNMLMPPNLPESIESELSAHFFDNVKAA